MVLVQILITAINNGSYFQIPISGNCSIRVLSAQGNCSAGGACIPFQIRSDRLSFPYSPLRYVTFLTNAQGTLNIDQAFNEYNITNCELHNQIQFQVVDATTGVAPANFQYCLLSLQIERINRTVDADTNTSIPSR